MKYISHPHILGIILKSGISEGYTEVELQRLKECRLGVVVPEAAPPVQTLWEIGVLCANFAKTLIFLPKLVGSTQMWYQMKAYMLHFIIV